MRKISVVTVSFNCQSTIEETIQSVIGQDYENLEYVIIDGKSTDHTVEIIKKYSTQINFFVSEKDKGIFDAMNKSLNFISGDYVLFMNAGDKFVNNHIVSDVFKDYTGAADLIYGDDYVQNKLGFMFRKADAIYHTYYTKRDLVFRSQGFSHQSLFTKVERLKEVMFNLNFPLGADYDTTWKIFEKNHSIKYVGLPISIFDDREGGASHNKRYNTNIIKERLQMFGYTLTVGDKIAIARKAVACNLRYMIMETFPRLTSRYRLQKRNYIDKIQ